MWQPTTANPVDKPELYRVLAGDLRGLLGSDRDWLTNTANAAALLAACLPDLNWAGFYFLRREQLRLGPFQGKPACVQIALGRGVCGTAAAQRRTVIVPDVHAFPGHIACDSASASEIVIPLLCGARLLGVLDLDSPQRARFDPVDGQGLETLAQILVAATDWPENW